MDDCRYHDAKDESSSKQGLARQGSDDSNNEADRKHRYERKSPHNGIGYDLQTGVSSSQLSQGHICYKAAYYGKDNHLYNGDHHGPELNLNISSS